MAQSCCIKYKKCCKIISQLKMCFSKLMRSIWFLLLSHWAAHWRSKDFFQHFFRSVALFKQPASPVSVAWQRRFSNLSWHWWNTSGRVQELQLNTQWWKCWLRTWVCVCVSLCLWASNFLKVKQQTEAYLMNETLNVRKCLEKTCFSMAAWFSLIFCTHIKNI